MGIRTIRAEQSAPTAAEELPDRLRKESEALRRAMPLSRLVGNGMEYHDALSLHGLSQAGMAWADAASQLGERNLGRGAAAAHAGSVATARSYYHYAAACFRFGQSAFVHDDDRKRALYGKARDAFSRAAGLDCPRIEKIAIPYRSAYLSGWLMRPAARRAPSLVIVFGGADGCREEYYTGARYLLERGLAALLLDGPGQGETRLFQGLHLTADVELAFSAAVDALLEDSRIGTRIGIWGNSLGGTFAARAAAADPRIAACCVNSGSANPLEILLRFPRFIARLAAMTGAADPARTLAIVEGLRIDTIERRIHCPLLVLHGRQDVLFALEGAQQLYDRASGADKELIVWENGDHCLYNHSHEKHCIVADWFHERLA